MTRHRGSLFFALLLIAPMAFGASQLRFSTYFGGPYSDGNQACAIDSAGNVYLTGYSWGGSNGPFSAFVSKLDPTGSTELYRVNPAYNGYPVTGSAIAVDDAGNAYVAGTLAATSTFIPVNALQPVIGGGLDAFIVKISPAGAVLFATYFGGSGPDSVKALTLDHSGNIIVVGSTSSQNFPTKNAFQATKNDYDDGFIAKLTGDGQTLIFSTYIGGNLGNFDGSGNDAVNGVAVDAQDNIYVTGTTGSPTFPLKNALRTTVSGQECFVARIDPAGALDFSTFIGGSGNDKGADIAIDRHGTVVITGSTSSPDFPLIDALKAPKALDTFVTRLEPTGSAILSTVLTGGSGNDQPSRLAISQNGRIYVTGSTDSVDFPAVNATQSSFGGVQDAFVVELVGPTIVYASYLGGSAGDMGLGIAVRGGNEVVVVGQTASSQFPVFDAAQPILSGSQDGYLTDLVVPVVNGDANADGQVNAADVFCLVNGLFAGGGVPAGPADANGDGQVDAADVFYLINYLFTGGAPPV